MGIIGRGGKTNGEQREQRSSGGTARTGTTVIAAGTRLVGSLTLTDSFHLDGAMEGNMESEGDVSIGQSGEFEGDIKARRVVVSGHFNGTLDCDRLEIVSTGRVTGEIQIAELVIESGGHFSGTSRIKNGEPQRQLSHQSEKTAAKPAEAAAS
ncbi:MAG: polymer-forming cytoskeletal protein [Xanthomonadales bacterium]|nr:polymer-forming cytoskeletal protein [Xanthomonadales bacterium]